MDRYGDLGHLEYNLRKFTGLRTLFCSMLRDCPMKVVTTFQSIQWPHLQQLTLVLPFQKAAFQTATHHTDLDACLSGPTYTSLEEVSSVLHAEEKSASFPCMVDASQLFALQMELSVSFTSPPEPLPPGA